MRCDQSHTDDGDRRRAIERLLEDESLTQGLVDEAAGLLLAWGTGWLDTAHRSAEGLSPAELDECAACLRRLMRRISERASRAPADQQVERVRELLSRLERAPGVEEGDEAA
jgi:hypothetical protein